MRSPLAAVCWRIIIALVKAHRKFGGAHLIAQVGTSAVADAQIVHTRDVH